MFLLTGRQEKKRYLYVTYSGVGNVTRYLSRNIMTIQLISAYGQLNAGLSAGSERILGVGSKLVWEIVQSWLWRWLTAGLGVGGTQQNSFPSCFPRMLIRVLQ